MSFSIVPSDPGVVRLHLDGELDEATIYVLRLELASLLRRRPKRVELSIPPWVLFDTTGRGVLLSFFDLLRAQGGRLLVCERGNAPIAVAEPRQLERLLTPASAR